MVICDTDIPYQSTNVQMDYRLSSGLVMVFVVSRKDAF